MLFRIISFFDKMRERKEGEKKQEADTQRHTKVASQAVSEMRFIRGSLNLFAKPRVKERPTPSFCKTSPRAT